MIVCPDVLTERAFGSKNMQGPVELLTADGILRSRLGSNSSPINISFDCISCGVVRFFVTTSRALAASNGVKPALLLRKRANLVDLSIFSISLWCSGKLDPYGNCVIFIIGFIYRMLPKFRGRVSSEFSNGFGLGLSSMLANNLGENFSR